MVGPSIGVEEPADPGKREASRTFADWHQNGQHYLLSVITVHFILERPRQIPEGSQSGRPHSPIRPLFCFQGASTTRVRGALIGTRLRRAERWCLGPRSDPPALLEGRARRRVNLRVGGGPRQLDTPEISGFSSRTTTAQSRFPFRSRIQAPWRASAGPRSRSAGTFAPLTGCRTVGQLTAGLAQRRGQAGPHQHGGRSAPPPERSSAASRPVEGTSAATKARAWRRGSPGIAAEQDLADASAAVVAASSPWTSRVPRAARRPLARPQVRGLGVAPPGPPRCGRGAAASSGHSIRRRSASSVCIQCWKKA